MSQPSSPARRSNWVLAAFSLPCLPYAALGLPLAAVLLNYYASDAVGLPLTMASLAFFAVRGIDIFFDPIVGWGMDRTRNRWGPYRTWITAGTPILMLATWMIFMVKPGASFAYLFVWLLVLYAGFSICTLAQLAWAAVLSPDYDQRSRTYGWWQAANIVGVLIALFIPVVVMKVMGGSFTEGVHAMGWFILVALPVTLAANLLFVPEPKPQKETPHGGLSAYLQLFRRPAVRKILICDLLLGLAPGITGALLYYFFESVKGFERSQSQMFLVIYFVAGLIGAPFWSWLATRVGKDRALQIASIVYAIVYLTVGFVPAGNFNLTAAALFVAGLPYAAGLLLLRAMMADIGDQVRLETGQDRMGLLFSFLSLTTKLGYALSAVAGYILGLAGFDTSEGAVNSGQALTVLQVLFLGAPTLLLLLAAWSLKRYPLTRESHAEVLAGLRARDALEAGSTAG
ncbi:MFS transporter [Caulobacter sp. 17J80-11]|uniref:MFS transporter n=1 Tax=Caulobacter sp. 17J80-11 TaxID=2763502 RepID=UPI0016535932|nr:MFS transporter [Caulobacter sp. 17J80-11]MBC6983272.1 MFS transporter [Caulobacter sp. 17J80-11]